MISLAVMEDSEEVALRSPCLIKDALSSGGLGERVVALELWHYRQV